MGCRRLHQRTTDRRDRSILSHISFDLLMETGRARAGISCSHPARESGLQLLQERPRRRHRRMMDEQQQHHAQSSAALLRSVELRAESDDPDAVVSTAYYAMFHAACAVLLLQGRGRLPKTHSSLDRPIWPHRSATLAPRAEQQARRCTTAFEPRALQPTTRSSFNSIASRRPEGTQRRALPSSAIAGSSQRQHGS